MGFAEKSESISPMGEMRSSRGPGSIRVGSHCHTVSQHNSTDVQN